MTDEEMVSGLKKRIIDSNLETYITMFNAGKILPESEPDWIEQVKFFNGLGEEEKRIFFSVIRQTQIDTLAGALAFLDGSYWVKGQDEDLKLVCLDNPEEKLNGDLTDIFLNTVYEWER
jgi:hypothetical protein